MSTTPPGTPGVRSPATAHTTRPTATRKSPNTVASLPPFEITQLLVTGRPERGSAPKIIHNNQFLKELNARKICEFLGFTLGRRCTEIVCRLWGPTSFNPRPSSISTGIQWARSGSQRNEFGEFLHGHPI